MADLTPQMVRGYHANIERLLQQKGGTLTPYVRVESQSSEKEFYEQIGGVIAEQVTTRFSASPQANTPFDRRMVTITPYHVGDFVDSFEKVQTLADPKSAIVENFVMALNRERDRISFQSIYGIAYTGKEGTTQVTWPTTASTSGGNRVDESFGAANSGLTVEKLVEANRQWEAFFNDPGQETPVCIINSAGKADLLNLTPVRSSDFNTVRALVRGEVDQFIFKFVTWEGYVQNGTNVMRGVSPGAGSEAVDRYFVFPKSAILSAVGMDVQTRIVERQDRSFHWYAYARAMFGSTRMQENKIMEIEAKR